MRRRGGRSFVRQMPRIYGSLQEPERSIPWATFGRFFRLFFWIALIVAAFYFLFLGSFFKVENVQVEGAVFVPAATVRAAVPLGGNIWRLPTHSIERTLLANPTVESVDILRGLPHSVRVVVHERPPAALWVSGDTVSILDPQGIAFRQYPKATPPAATTPLGAALAKLPTVIDTKNLPVAASQPLVSPTFVSFLEGAETQLTSLLPQLTIDHFEVADTIYSVTLFTKQGMTVQFNTLADPGVQVRNLTRLVRDQHVLLTAKVDLRIDRWAYVQ